MPRGNAYNEAYLGYQQKMLESFIEMAGQEQTDVQTRIDSAQAQIDRLNGQIAELSAAVDDPDMQRSLANDQFAADLEIANFQDSQRATITSATGTRTVTGDVEDEGTPTLYPHREVQQLSDKEELAEAWAGLAAADVTEEEALQRSKTLLQLAKNGFSDASLTVSEDEDDKDKLQAATNVASVIAAGMDHGLSKSSINQLYQAATEELKGMALTDKELKKYILTTAKRIHNDEGPIPGKAGGVRQGTSTTTDSSTSISRKLGPDTPAPTYVAPDIQTPEQEAELQALRGQRASLEDQIESLMGSRHPDVMARAQTMFQQYAPIYKEKSARARQLAGEFSDAQMMRKTGIAPQDLLRGTALEGIDPSMYSKLDMSALPQTTRSLAEQAQKAQVNIDRLSNLEAKRGSRIPINKYTAARARGSQGEEEETQEEVTSTPDYRNMI
jgi:hypothetical protein